MYSLWKKNCFFFWFNKEVYSAEMRDIDICIQVRGSLD
jgi:hypothetical protein